MARPTGAFNEYSPLAAVAVRGPERAFASQERIDEQWNRLRYTARPDLAEAVAEHRRLVAILAETGAEVLELPGGDLTIDSIYVRDALVRTPRGLVACRMGRPTRGAEPRANLDALVSAGYAASGSVSEPGTVEGGDVVWFDETTVAVGLGPRTNAVGAEQLAQAVGPGVEVVRVPLPAPEHPEDVLHLMSALSPLDSDLCLVYRPILPGDFLEWLESRGVRLLDVPAAEYRAMAGNVLALAPRRVVMLEGCPLTRSLLEDAGCRVTTYRGNHISLAGQGGPTCLTLPLARRGG